MIFRYRGSMEELNDEEKRSLAFAGGILLFSAVAIIAFFLKISIVFYVCAILAIGMGLYMAYNLSRPQASQASVAKPQQNKVRRSRPGK